MTDLNRPDNELTSEIKELISNLFIEDQRTRGKPTLPDQDESVARAWLGRILIDRAALELHKEELQHRYLPLKHSRHGPDRPSGSVFLQNELLREERAFAVVNRGLNELNCEEVARLLLNPYALTDLAELIEAEEPAWRDAAMIALGEELLDENLVEGFDEDLVEASSGTRQRVAVGADHSSGGDRLTAGYSSIDIHPEDKTRTKPGDLALPTVPPPQPRRGLWQDVWFNAVVALICFGFSMFGLLSRTFPDGIVCAFWPAAGYSLLVVLFYRYRAVAGLFVGGFSANLFMVLLAHERPNLVFALFAGLGNVLQAVAARFVLRNALQGPRSVLENSDLLGVLKVLLQAAFCCTISASFGVGSYYLSTGRELFQFALLEHWLIWLVGDTIGMLVCAPLALAFLVRARVGKLTLAKIGRLRFACWVLFLVGISALVSCLPASPWVAVSHCVALYFVAWSSFRLGRICGHLAALLLTASATVGVFFRSPEHLLDFQTVISLYLFQLMVVVVSIHLGNAIRRARIEAERYRVINEVSPTGYFQADFRGACGWFSAAALELQGLHSLEECEQDGWYKNLYPGKHAESAKSRWQEYIRAGDTQPFSDLRIYVTPDGVKRVVEVEARPLFDHGLLIGYFGTLRELSNATKAVQIREELNREFAKLLPEDKRRFVELVIDPDIPDQVTLPVDILVSAFRILVARAAASRGGEGRVSIRIRAEGPELRLSLSNGRPCQLHDWSEKEEVIAHLNSLDRSDQKLVRIMGQ